jgi:hypothetical protein
LKHASGKAISTSNHMSRLRADTEISNQDQRSDGLDGFGFKTGKKQKCFEIL